MVNMSDIENAAKVIEGHVHTTPVLSASSINQMLGMTIRFKCENFQKVGAFKARGACNAVFSLPDEAAGKGVATHSSGNPQDKVIVKIFGSFSISWRRSMISVMGGLKVHCIGGRVSRGSCR